MRWEANLWIAKRKSVNGILEQTENEKRRSGGVIVGTDEQLGLDLGVPVEQTEWGKWIDPDRRAAQVRKFLDHAGLQRIPSKPWPKGSPDVKRLDTIVAELFPDMTTAMAAENAHMADAFICFLGECYIKFAAAQWYDFEWRGREHSFYDHVNPALRFGDDFEDGDTAWSFMESVTAHSKWGDGFSLMADELREEYARREPTVT